MKFIIRYMLISGTCVMLVACKSVSDEEKLRQEEQRGKDEQALEKAKNFPVFGDNATPFEDGSLPDWQKPR